MIALHLFQRDIIDKEAFLSASLNQTFLFIYANICMYLEQVISIMRNVEWKKSVLPLLAESEEICDTLFFLENSIFHTSIGKVCVLFFYHRDSYSKREMEHLITMLSAAAHGAKALN